MVRYWYGCDIDRADTGVSDAVVVCVAGRPEWAPGNAPASYRFTYLALGASFCYNTTSMNFELITLAGSKVNKQVYEVIIPTSAGEIAVFPGHEPLVSVAVPGIISVRHDKNDPDERMEYFAISGGVIEIDGKHVRVLVDEADHGADIIEAESKAALERAMNLRDTATGQVEIEKAHQLVDRHAIRLKVADLHRRHHR